jgi:L-iditol 2-dehydrogenase
VGRVEQAGADATSWHVGDRLYGDTYGGYAEFAIIPVEPGSWSRGPLPIPETISVGRAIFIEPLADCFHGVKDQAGVHAGDQLVVIGSGAMGIKSVAVAAKMGVRVLVVEPIESRRKFALRFGAEEAVAPADWAEKANDWTNGKGAAAVLLTIGVTNLVGDCIRACGPGGRVVLFAGFGNDSMAMVDCNDLHYHEISLVGSEWVGTPPNQRRERYDAALELLLDESLPFDELVTGTCGFSDLETAFIQHGDYNRIKTMFVTGGIVNGF